jgi:hypothetical protein
MTRFVIAETYLYEVEAKDEDEAQALFEEYAGEGMTFEAGLNTGVKYTDNQIEIGKWGE